MNAYDKQMQVKISRTKERNLFAESVMESLVMSHYSYLTFLYCIQCLIIYYAHAWYQEKIGDKRDAPHGYHF